MGISVRRTVIGSWPKRWISWPEICIIKDLSPLMDPLPTSLMSHLIAETFIDLVTGKMSLGMIIGMTIDLIIELVIMIENGHHPEIAWGMVTGVDIVALGKWMPFGKLRLSIIGMGRLIGEFLAQCPLAMGATKDKRYLLMTCLDRQKGS